MYITCEQCSTIFRLDEELLKPNGSKVRCSQCRSIFVAKPPAIPDALEDDYDIPAPPLDKGHDSDDQEMFQYDEAFDQELEGIDLAELDSIIEEGRSTQMDSQVSAPEEEDAAEVLSGFDESDLDMDFESALGQDTEDLPAQKAVPAMAAKNDTGPLDALGSDLDLDMDFELDDWDDDVAQPSVEARGDDIGVDVDLDMDFDLDDGMDETTVIEPAVSVPSADHGAVAEGLLGENVELALDDFEDVLGQVEGEEVDDLPTVDITDEELELDFEPAEETVALTPEREITEKTEIPAVDASGGDLDLTGLDAFLAEDDDAPQTDDDREEVELSLDGDAGAAASVESADDGLDLVGDLDALLDGDDDDVQAAASDDGSDDLTLDDDMELSLADDMAVDAQEADTLMAPDSAAISDDLDLGDLDALLEGDDEDKDGASVSGSDDLFASDDELELSLDDEAPVAGDTGEAPTVAAVDSQEDNLDLGDLDALLDGDDDGQAEGDDATLSLDDDLAFSLDEEATVAIDRGEPDDVAAVDSQQDNLDLGDLDSLLDGDDDDQTGDHDEPLSLDDDFELSLDDDATVAMTPDAAASADSEADDLDLGDLDDMLDLDDDKTLAAGPQDDAFELGMGGEKPQAAAAQESESEEFDLSDFEGLLDEEEAPAAAGAADDDTLFDMSDIDGGLEQADSSEADDLELTLDDDFELSLDDEAPLDSATDSSVVARQQGDDLDLSGLEETLLDGDALETSEAAGEDMELSLDDELDFSLDDDLEGAASSDAGEGLGELEDLDFELDADQDEKTVIQSNDSLEAELTLDDEPSDEALDLTDIEKMLEEDNIVSEKAPAIEVAAADDGWSDDLGMQDDEIDLGELEEAIVSAEDEPDSQFVDDGQELELDLDLEPEAAPEIETAGRKDEIEELDLELEDDDLRTLELDSQEDDLLDATQLDFSLDDDSAAIETETVDAGEMQLEFQIEETSGQTLGEETVKMPTGAAASVSATSGFMESEQDFSGEETIASERPPEQPSIGMTPVPKPSRGKKPLIIIIPVLLLAMVLGYFGYNLAKKSDVRIPFISDYLNPKPKDPSGVLQLATMDINSKFIENETEGRLFVITGKVRNGYSVARKMIRLRGKLFTKGKVQVKTEQAFAGLVMGDQELSSSSIADIKKRLNAAADQQRAVTIEAGKSVPFMVVFSDLPSDLDEFVIELVSSNNAE